MSQFCSGSSTSTAAEGLPSSNTVRSWLKRAYAKFAGVSCAFATMEPSRDTTSTLSTPKRSWYSTIFASVAAKPASLFAMKATLAALDWYISSKVTVFCSTPSSANVSRPSSASDSCCISLA